MSVRSFVSFQLDDLLFGIDIGLVREINQHLDVTPVPHAPEYIRGLINLRGQIVTVIDLKQRLGLGSSQVTAVSHNIILKTESELTELNGEMEAPSTVSDKAGFWVDDIRDVVTIDSESIEAPPANVGAIEGKCLSGVVKLENALMGILSISTVLQDKPN